MTYSVSRRIAASILFAVILALSFFFCAARAEKDLGAAYTQAAREAGPTTSAIVESIDLAEFQDHYGITLTAEEEKLVRLALMTYSNGAILQHPVGIDSVHLASLSGDTYVGNRNTGKFHYSWCSSVSDIKEKNKVTFSSREEAVAQGYTGCKRCNP